MAQDFDAALAEGTRIAVGVFTAYAVARELDAANDMLDDAQPVELHAAVYTLAAAFTGFIAAVAVDRGRDPEAMVAEVASDFAAYANGAVPGA